MKKHLTKLWLFDFRFKFLFSNLSEMGVFSILLQNANDQNRPHWQKFIPTYQVWIARLNIFAFYKGLTLCVCFILTPAVLNSYSWPCTQKLLLKGSGTIGMLGTELRLAMCKENTLPVVLSLRSPRLAIWKVVFSMQSIIISSIILACWYYENLWRRMDTLHSTGTC